MTTAATTENPVRVAVVGAGPAGFYAAAALLKEETVEVDMFDRLPTPFGLVRAGVAPDHQKDKSVTRAYDRTAGDPRFRFFGNICYGQDVGLDDLRRFYHQIVFATGSPTDRSLGIPGEALPGSHSATDFVAWYNGHPDHVDDHFDLDCEQVAVIGIGNVALDVARILCRTYDELKVTDIADHALAALRQSRIRDVHVIGRRGPAQAAFTPPEVAELGKLADADVIVDPGEAVLDPASRDLLSEHPDRIAERNVALIQEYASRPRRGAARRLHLHFFRSPLEVLGHDRVRGVRLAHNSVVRGSDGPLRVQATGEEEILPVSMVLRSVGYRALPLPELPFDADRGVVRNLAGRVVDTQGAPHTGLYVTGWIKRGPTGVIGTNKVDAKETVERMVEDRAGGLRLEPEAPTAEAVARFVASLPVRAISYADWCRIDAEEIRRGERSGRPRVKLTRREEFLDVIDR